MGYCSLLIMISKIIVKYEKLLLTLVAWALSLHNVTEMGSVKLSPCSEKMETSKTSPTVNDLKISQYLYKITIILLK